MRRIKLLALDVDGVMTDGKIISDAQGIESKNFDVQDGLGLVLLRQCGIKTMIISARHSDVVKYRAEDLKIDRVFVGVQPKLESYQKTVKEFGIGDGEVCYIGDDLTDLVIMKRVGFAAAVANAVFEIKRAAHYVTKHCGGEGAVREVIELILRAQGKWGTALYEH